MKNMRMIKAAYIDGCLSLEALVASPPDLLAIDKETAEEIRAKLESTYYKLLWAKEQLTTTLANYDIILSTNSKQSLEEGFKLFEDWLEQQDVEEFDYVKLLELTATALADTVQLLINNKELVVKLNAFSLIVNSIFINTKKAQIATLTELSKVNPNITITSEDINKIKEQ